MKVTVAKFGGTSMGTAEAMQNAAAIVIANPDTRVVVVSATSGTTNQLLELSESLQPGLIAEIRARHLALAESLDCGQSCREGLEKLFEEARRLTGTAMSAQSLDQLLSIGERLSSLIFTEALTQAGRPSQWIDARSCIKTDSIYGKAEPNPESTKTACQKILLPLLQQGQTLVTQGFIGASADDNTTTLGRGGSDYSAALFAEALQAQEVEIWTDVPGVLTMDPRVVASARVIAEISFAEAAEMANFGAKVLHPATLWPAVRAEIPVFVGSTFAAKAKGTRILPSIQSQAPLIRAIAARKRQTLITVSSLRMLNAHGFLARMFEVLARHHVSVDLVTTSEVSVALTIDEGSLGSSGKGIAENQALLTELRSFAEVTIESDLALVAIIGNGLSMRAGVAAKAFQSINEFNLRLICHGASEHNLCFLVEARQADEVAKRLHHVCIEWSQL